MICALSKIAAIEIVAFSRMVCYRRVSYSHHALSVLSDAITHTRARAQVRPAFMEEYEALEHELRGVYEVYMERFRNLRWVPSQRHRALSIINHQLVLNQYIESFDFEETRT